MVNNLDWRLFSIVAAMNSENGSCTASGSKTASELMRPARSRPEAHSRSSLDVAPDSKGRTAWNLLRSRPVRRKPNRQAPARRLPRLWPRSSSLCRAWRSVQQQQLDAGRKQGPKRRRAASKLPARHESIAACTAARYAPKQKGSKALRFASGQLPAVGVGTRPREARQAKRIT